MRRISTLIALLILCCPAAALAQTTDLSQAAVSPDSPDANRRLLRGVFPGLREEVGGVLVLTADKRLRQPGSKERTDLAAGARITSVDALEAREGAQEYIVLLAQVDDPQRNDIPGGGGAVLAVFRKGEAEPQDVAEVKTDMLTSLTASGAVQLGGSSTFLVNNAHFNSNQGYQDATLYHIRKGRLRRVAAVFTLGQRGMCGKSFSEALRWSTLPDPGNPFPRVRAEVILARGPEADELAQCPKGTKRHPAVTYSSTYRWNAAQDRHQLEQDGFKALEAFNKNNF